VPQQPLHLLRLGMVELREGGAEGRSRRWVFDDEAEAAAFVERALAAKQTDWKKMTG
jgi:hypothetical protein